MGCPGTTLARSGWDAWPVKRRGASRPRETIEKNHLSRPKSRDASQGCWNGKSQQMQGWWEGDVRERQSVKRNVSPSETLRSRRRKCTVPTCRLAHVQRSNCTEKVILSRDFGYVVYDGAVTEYKSDRIKRDLWSCRSRIRVHRFATIFYFIVFGIVMRIITFQVRVAGSGVRGWLDASHETNNWLKYIRSTTGPHAVNMRHVLIGGQVTEIQ